MTWGFRILLEKATKRVDSSRPLQQAESDECGMQRHVIRSRCLLQCHAGISCRPNLSLYRIAEEKNDRALATLRLHLATPCAALGVLPGNTDTLCGIIGQGSSASSNMKFGPIYARAHTQWDEQTMVQSGDMISRTSLLVLSTRVRLFPHILRVSFFLSRYIISHSKTNVKVPLAFRKKARSFLR